MRRPTVLSLPLQLVFPGTGYYRLPRLQQMVVPVALINITAAQAVPIDSYDREY
jgi:hypothetical protein